MWLNEIEVDIPSSVRLSRCIKLCKFSFAEHSRDNHTSNKPIPNISLNSETNRRK